MHDYSYDFGMLKDDYQKIHTRTRGLPLLHCLLITNAHAVCAHTTVTACFPLVRPVPVNEIDHGNQQPDEDLLI